MFQHTTYVTNLITNYLKSVKSNGLISAISYRFTANKVTIQFLYYNPLRPVSNEELMTLTSLLEQYFSLQVELVINQIRYPYLNAQILAQYLVLNSDKARFKFIKRSIYRHMTMSPSIWKHLSVYMTGIKVNIHGRLVNEKVIPRKTKLTMSKGTITPIAVKGQHVTMDKGSYTFKNQYGSYTISVTIAQVIKSTP